MRAVIYAPEADQDLADIWDRISVDSDFYATRYVNRLQAKVRFLATLTNPGRTRDDVTLTNVRSYTERSHFILFALTDDRLTVLRIIHSARDVKRIRFE